MANSNGWGDGAANNAIGWGKGADNAIGWGAIHADSWAGATDIVGTPAVDPDAQAFITAAAITDSTQQSAINQLVVDLKGYNIWTKFSALYPFVGGTNAQHTWNLKNTAQYKITWAGGVTSSSLGVKFNGTNSYGNTGFNPSLNSSLNSNGLGFYSGTNLSETSADPVNMGGLNIGDFYVILKSNTTLAGRLNATSISASSAIMRGFFSAQKTSSTVTTIYKESTSLATGNSGGALPNVNLFLGTLNLGGTPYGSGYIVNDMRFAYISDGLNSTEIGNLYTAVQAFQTTLGRSIGTQTVSDADAQAFVTNAGIVDQVEANAINNLVIGLKADGLWTKMKAVYPFVGGTSTTNSYNLRNTAQNQISWSGGVTHSSNGVQFGGVNGYGNTNLNLTALNKDNIHFSFYSRTNNTTQAFDMGQTGFTGNAFSLLTHYGGALKGRTILSATGSDALDETTYTNTTGLLIGTRQNSNNVRIFRNAVKTESNTNNSVATVDSGNIFIGARNQLTIADAANYTNRQAAFISIGDNLTDTDAANLTTAVQAFQTTLGRQVGTPIPLTGTLLNDYPDAAAAYSLRKLRTAYTGSAIRVRRSSDNTEQDFGFVNNVLDTASLLTFCGAGNGFVTTWYDQSGNGVNATQSTAVNQPQIVSSGVLISVNSNNAIRFNSKFLTFSTTGSLPSNISVFAVRNLTTYPTSYNTLFNYKTYGLTHNLNGGTAYGVAHIFSNSTSQASLDYPTTTGQALDFIFNQANLERNNFVATLPNGNVYAAGSNSIGSWSGTSQLFNGEIQELVIYESNQNTNKAGIKSNINTFYTIY